jgi:hypothetical protein
MAIDVNVPSLGHRSGASDAEEPLGPGPYAELSLRLFQRRPQEFNDKTWGLEKLVKTTRLVNVMEIC